MKRDSTVASDGKGSPDAPISRRERILDEAMRLAGRFGYRGFSFKDLAERCTLTKQGVLHYFPSKENLLLTLLNERDSSIESELLAILSQEEVAQVQAAPGEPMRVPRAILYEGLARIVEEMARSPELIRLHVILRAEAIGEDHPARDYFAARDRNTLAWLTDRLEGIASEPHSTARLLLATMIGLQSQWLQEDASFDLCAEWRRALAALLPLSA